MITNGTSGGLTIPRAAEFTKVEEFLELAPPPAAAIEHAKGTDVESDVPLIYAATMIQRPRLIVELGTRTGMTTRTLAYAAKQLGARFITIDPDDCLDFIRDVEPCDFIRMTGEEAFNQQKIQAPIDVLMVDTDRHTYEQSMGWLKTWVTHLLRPGGLAFFHDLYPPDDRVEIQVRQAVLDWLKRNPKYFWREFLASHDGLAPLAHGPYGLGLLWKLA